MLSSVWVTCGYYFIDSLEKILSNFRYFLQSNLYAKQRKRQTPITTKPSFNTFSYIFIKLDSQQNPKNLPFNFLTLFHFQQNAHHRHLDTVIILTIPGKTLAILLSDP
ncbi:hypothetical protein JYT30_00525 [Desulfotalea psychrophila]|nr:hypothetical protein [Desulfotalea psychrophila]